MKKFLKITLIGVGVLTFIIVLDTLQARIFKGSPLISWEEKLDKASYVDKGILMDTYYCVKEQDIVNVSWHFKTSKFTCPLTELSLEDIFDIISNYMENNPNNDFDYAYNYVDKENKVVMIGLLNNDDTIQEEFINTIFPINGDYIKDNSLIMFKESKYVFDAKIITAEENSIMVEVLKDSDSFNKGDKVTMKITRPTDGTDDFYVEGNKVRITFNGNVLQSDPAQIGASKIELISYFF